MKSTIINKIISFLLTIIAIVLINSNLVYSQKVTKLFNKGKIDKAKEYCLKQKGDKQKECYTELADLYFAKKNYNEAATYYEKSSSPSQGFKKLADVYFDKKEYEIAAKYYQKTSEPQIGFLKIAEDYCLKQKFTEAAVFYKKADNKEGLIKIADLLMSKEPVTINYSFYNSKLMAIPAIKSIIVTSTDSKIVVWDLITNEIINELEINSDKIINLNTSPDGKYIVFGCPDNDKSNIIELKIWGLDVGKQINSIEINAKKIYNIKISDNNKYLAVAYQRTNYDKHYRVWNIQTGELIINNGSYATNVLFTPDSKRLIVDNFKKIKIINIETGKTEKTLSEHENYIKEIRISPNGKYLASIGYKSYSNSELKIWDIENKTQLNSFSYPYRIFLNEISIDNKYFITCNDRDRKKINIHELISGKKIREISTFNNVYWIKNNLSSKYLVARICDSIIKYPNIESDYSEAENLYAKVHQNNKNELKNCYKKIANRFLEKGHYIKAEEYYKKVYKNDNEKLKTCYFKIAEKLFEAENYSEAEKFYQSAGKKEEGLFKIADAYLQNGEIHKAEIYYNKTQRKNEGYNKIAKFYLNSSELIKVLLNYPQQIITTTSDNKCFVTKTSSNELSIKDINTSNEVKHIKIRSVNSNSIVISKNNKYAAGIKDYGFNNFSIILWNIETAHQIKSWKGHSKTVNQLKISPDSKYLVSASNDCTIKIWNLQNAKEIKTLKGHSNAVKSIAISPDNKYIISGSGEMYKSGEIKIWNIKTADEVKTIQGFEGIVTFLKITADNKYIVANSERGELKFFEFNTGKLIYSKNYMLDVIVSPNDKYFISGFRLYDLKTGKFVRELNRNIGKQKVFTQKGKYFIVRNKKNVELWFTDKDNIAYNYYIKSGDTDKQANLKIANYYLSKNQFKLAGKFFEKSGNAKKDMGLEYAFQVKAKEGDPLAQFVLGGKYYYGDEVKKDLKKAAQWYLKSAEQNYQDAQFMLGFLYNKGEGVKKDYKKSLQWYQKAAKQGHKASQLAIGLIYRDGIGVEKKPDEAFIIISDLAEQGFPEAQYELGQMYYTEEIHNKNYQIAFEWFMKAAKQNNQQAMLNLGLMYTLGQGVEKDLDKARYWMNLAKKISKQNKY